MLTSRFDHAFLYAQELHRAQTRKGTETPYISHLMTVSALVIENGGDEDHSKPSRAGRSRAPAPNRSSGAVPLARHGRGCASPP